MTLAQDHAQAKADLASVEGQLKRLNDRIDTELKHAIKLSEYCLSLAEQSLEHAQKILAQNERLLADLKRTTEKSKISPPRRMFR